VLTLCTRIVATKRADALSNLWDLVGGEGLPSRGHMSNNGVLFDNGLKSPASSEYQYIHKSEGLAKKVVQST